MRISISKTGAVKPVQRTSRTVDLLKKMVGQKALGIKSFAAVLIVLSAGIFPASQVQALDKAPDVWSFISRLATKSLLVDITTHGDRIFAAGDHGHIVFSDDDGETWTQAKVPTTQLLTGIDFPTPKKGWAVGHDGNIFYSEDAGESWILQYDGLAHRAEANKASVQRSKDLLATKKTELGELQQKILAEKSKRKKSRLEGKLEDIQWEMEEAEADMEYYQGQVANTVEPPLLDVWFENENSGIVIGAFGKAMRTDDGGKTWESIKDLIDNPDEVHFNSIEGDADGSLFISAEMGMLFRSSDFGKTWKTLNSPYSGSFFGIAFNEKTKSVLTFGISGAIYRSSDWGDTWKPLDIQVANSLNGAVFTRDGGATVVGVGGYVLTSFDDGLNMQLDVLPRRQHMNKVVETSKGRLIGVGEGGVHIIPEIKKAEAVASSSK